MTMAPVPPGTCMSMRDARGPASVPSIRTAVITGSISGIGFGIADTLAGAGAEVMLDGFGDYRPSDLGRCQRALDQVRELRSIPDAPCQLQLAGGAR